MAKPTTTGDRMASRAGVASSRCAAAVQMSITRPYSGRSVRSMIPGCSRNCRRTSCTTVPAERPTARDGQGREQEGDGPADQQPDEGLRVGDVDDRSGDGGEQLVARWLPVDTGRLAFSAMVWM